ncbi:MAG: hypothetical protein FWD68_09225 [Alphaproteobacteria bacterium]|nr:hypothetical protein [Alphaproteobacteria bacterium]
MMRPIGYLFRRVAPRPGDFLPAAVERICSLSGCLSENFADYVGYWKHNGFWLFDSPAILRDLAKEHAIALDGLTLFYYEAYELQYDGEQKAWTAFEPEPFPTDIEIPQDIVLEGFDVVSFWAGALPECSPLSCNGLAGEIPTNRNCLAPTLDVAIEALEAGKFEHAEPGPYRIIAVWSVPNG